MTTKERDSSPRSGDKKELDEQLGDALKQTFPASDPVSVGGETVEPEGRVTREAPGVNVDLAKKLARKLDREHAGDK